MYGYLPLTPLAYEPSLFVGTDHVATINPLKETLTSSYLHRCEPSSLIAAINPLHLSLCYTVCVWCFRVKKEQMD
ncbi:hypothetical protein Hanom_Chr04g00304171 [Helianthus anomalus]